MLDAHARRLVTPALDRAAAKLADAGVPATALTAAGFVAGVGACVAIAVRWWPLGLVLWLANRLLDGLDGSVARRRGATELGGFFDIVADFTIYAGVVLAVAVAVPRARLACLVLLVAYYVSGTAFLALSSILERQRRTDLHRDRYNDGRSLRFVGGLAEGTETVIAYVAFTAFPAQVTTIAWVFAAAVAVTAIQRVRTGIHLLAPSRPTQATPTLDESAAEPAAESQGHPRPHAPAGAHR